MPRGLARKTIELREACHAIMEQIQPASVRAVCYQLFTRKLIPNMSKASTDKISRILTQAREDGYIPWSWVVDEGRRAERVPSWDDPDEYADVVANGYRRDRWTQQPQRVEVWSEKGTIRGTLMPVFQEYGVTLRVLHGYSSATVVHEVAMQTRNAATPLTVYYVGDWDCSGMNMSEVDLPKRLREYGAKVKLQRIALGREDILDPDLPSFPAADKRKDARYPWFVKHYGERCWELDALDPRILRQRVAGYIEMIIDREAWERCDVAEQAELASLRNVMHVWRELAS